MLPASLHVPGAIVLLVVGLVTCVAGYRLFRFVLGVYGFIVGALFATPFVPPDNTLVVIVAAVVGGVLGALVLTLAYFLGVFLAGAGAGAIVADVLWASRTGQHAPLLVALLVAVVAGGLALAFQRYVIIVATAFGGAWTAVTAAVALLGSRIAAGAPARTLLIGFIVDPRLPADAPGWIPLAWFALGMVGTFVQLRATARPVRRRSGRQP